MENSAIKAHRTVSRVTAILEFVAGEPRAPLSKIAASLDAPKSSVFGLVKGLVSTGYLAEVGGGYSLGPAIASLLRAGGTPALVDVAGTFLEELRDTFDETVMLSTQVGDSLIYVAAAESSQPIRYSAPLRVRRPLYPTSSGKAFLAWWSPARRRAYLHSVIDNQERLANALEELETVRATGIAYNRGETLPDVSAAACPIRVRGAVVGVVAIAGPTIRMGPTLQDAPVALTDICSRLAERLG